MSAVLPDLSEALADAVATAMLVMGREQALAWAERHPEVSVLFLSVDEDGGIRKHATPGFFDTHTLLSASAR